MEEEKGKTSNAVIADRPLTRSLLSYEGWDLCDARVGADDIELPSFISYNPSLSEALISEASNRPHPYNLLESQLVPRVGTDLVTCSFA